MQRAVIIAIILLALGGGGVVVYSKVRGIRNNNPGNLERTGDQWRGLAPEQTDSRFFVFSEPVWGIRAMSQTLTNYYNRHGLRTIRGIINRWAPSVENDTESYIQSVSRRIGRGPDEVLSLQVDLKPLVKAIIRHENGIQPYSDALIQQGIDLVFR